MLLGERGKRREDYLWFKLLDRFGLPTVAFLIMLLFMIRESERQSVQIDDERKANREVVSAAVNSINANTLAVQGMVINLQALNEKVAAIENRLSIKKRRVEDE